MKKKMILAFVATIGSSECVLGVDETEIPLNMNVKHVNEERINSDPEHGTSIYYNFWPEEDLKCPRLTFRVGKSGESSLSSVDKWVSVAREHRWFKSYKMYGNFELIEHRMYRFNLGSPENSHINDSEVAYLGSPEYVNVNFLSDCHGRLDHDLIRSLINLEGPCSGVDRSLNLMRTTHQTVMASIGFDVVRDHLGKDHPCARHIKDLLEKEFEERSKS